MVTWWGKGDMLPGKGGSDNDGKTDTTRNRNSWWNHCVLIYLYRNNAALWPTIIQCYTVLILRSSLNNHLKKIEYIVATKISKITLSPAFTLVSCSPYLILKMEAECSSEMLDDFQWTTRRYISEDGTLLKFQVPQTFKNLSYLAVW
jgi:hypothetical protein